jgi:hypothetical protein
MIVNRGFVVGNSNCDRHHKRRSIVGYDVYDVRARGEHFQMRIAESKNGPSYGLTPLPVRRDESHHKRNRQRDPDFDDL